MATRMAAAALFICFLYGAHGEHCQYKFMDSDNGWAVNVCTLEMNGTNTYYVKDECTSNTSQIRTRFDSLYDCENNMNGVDDTNSIWPHRPCGMSCDEGNVVLVKFAQFEDAQCTNASSAGRDPTVWTFPWVTDMCTKGNGYSSYTTCVGNELTLTFYKAVGENWLSIYPECDTSNYYQNFTLVSDHCLLAYRGAYSIVEFTCPGAETLQPSVNPTLEPIVSPTLEPTAPITPTVANQGYRVGMQITVACIISIIYPCT